MDALLQGNQERFLPVSILSHPPNTTVTALFELADLLKLLKPKDKDINKLGIF